MRLPVTSAFGLAAETLASTFRHFRPIATAFIVPELCDRLLRWVELLLAANRGVPHVIPVWMLSALDLFLDSFIFVAIIRYMVLGVEPLPIPKNVPWRAIALTSSILIPLWFVLDSIASRNVLFHYYFDWVNPAPDPEMSHRVYVAIGFYVYTVSALAIAAFYPLLGPIATDSRLEFRKVLNWQRTSFVAIAFTTALLIAALSMIERLYYSMLWASFRASWMHTTRPAPISTGGSSHSKNCSISRPTSSMTSCRRSPFRFLQLASAATANHRKIPLRQPVWT